MPRTTDIHGKIEALQRFYDLEGRVPTFAEMVHVLKYRSKNAVHRLMQKLVVSGHVEKKDDGKIHFTTRLIGTFRLLGKVEAGFPSPAEEELVDLQRLDEMLIKKRTATFGLRVSGDSMADELHDGDLVLVERGRKPKSGDIVVAYVDGGWTLKYFEKAGRDVRLVPANKKYKVIVPTDELRVEGVVISAIRQYGG